MNEITIKNNTVILHLKKETRFIGEIKGNVYVKRINPGNHLFRRFKAVGFNYRFLKDYDFKFIMVEIGNHKLKTSREYVLEKGQILNFKKKDFERQIFLPLSEFGLDKLREFEEARKPETDLRLFS